MITIAVTFAVALIAGAVQIPSVRTEEPVSVVLVHGAFVDGSGWQAVYDILTKEGFEVLIVQNPTISLEGDIAATERVIARAKHPVVLVGHSYGGMVITEAGTHPKVRSLVYLAAFAPDAGESVETLAASPAPPGESKAPLLPPQDGYLLVDSLKFPTAFAADVDPAATRFMAAAQVPWGLGAVQTPITKVAWKTKPARHMVTTKDGMIPPTAQRTMAKRTGAKTVEIASSHAVMLSHPQEVAALIKDAAAQAKIAEPASEADVVDGGTCAAADRPPSGTCLEAGCASRAIAGRLTHVVVSATADAATDARTSAPHRTVAPPNAQLVYGTGSWRARRPLRRRRRAADGGGPTTRAPGSA